MLYYDIGQENVNVTIGRDAGYYHPNCPNLPWNDDIQPFGYAGVEMLFARLGELLDKEEI
jgi:nitrogenase molybdenum-cofactor synthesis protein NifE